MPRLAYLDHIRILLTVLVIFHHIAANYSDAGGGLWYYAEPVSGAGSLLAFVLLTTINQAFFMGCFFFIAGYFVPPSVARKGPASFLRDRLVRLGIPLVVYVLVIHPFVWWLGRGSAWHIGTGPMWFVEVLLIFSVVYLLAKPFAPALGVPRIDMASTTALALAMGVGSFLVRIRQPVDEWLAFPTIQPAHATQYVCLFVVGAWLSGADLASRLTPALTRYWRRAMLLASTALAVAFILTDVPGDGKTDFAPFIGGGSWQSFVFALWEQVLAVGLITNLVALFGARAGYPRPILSSAAASAYTVYIVHPILLVLVALALRDVPISSLAKFLITAPLAVLVLFGVARWIRQAPVLRAIL